MSRHSESNQLKTLKSMLENAQVLQGVQILLVEDEPDVAELFRFILKEAGAEVVSLTEAEPALVLLRYSQPDVLLSNIRLPYHNGDWLIRQIRAHDIDSVRQLPAVAITSYLRDVNVEPLLEAGFDAFLPKPVDPDELIATLLLTMQRRTT